MSIRRYKLLDKKLTPNCITVAKHRRWKNFGQLIKKMKDRDWNVKIEHIVFGFMRLTFTRG